MKEDPLADPHQANRTFWDASTEWWKEREDQRGRGCGHPKSHV